ncbi:MAG TPA: DUF4159 domain-containing protein, partial [Tepidisphaeraceae bacterium]|nr:DUF4159 domain-containing protein [Tepidisphaeraceae bacterium]
LPQPQVAQTRPNVVVASKPAVVHIYQPGDIASDGDVGEAINRGVDYLLAHMRNGEIDDGQPAATPDHAGQDALVVYALLCAEQATGDPRLDIRGPFMINAIEHLKRLTLNTDPELLQAPITYGRGLRARALALYNRPEDAAALAEDVAWLVHAEIDGSYTYDDRFSGTDDSNPPPLPAPGEPIEVIPPADQQRLPPPVFDHQMPGGFAPPLQTQPPQVWDNANTFFATIAVAAGCDAGVDVSQDYWRDVQQHWSDCQLDDGSWANTSDEQSGSMQMTSAGIACLLAAQNFLDVDTFGERINIPDYSGPLANGLAWLEQGDNSIDVFNSKTVYLGYNLEAVEQAGLETGFKHFGRHDWYGELAAQAIATQWPAGSWGRKDSGVGAIIDTSYVVAFLSRGRAPVMMTKLRFAPVWDNRPRDLANLASYASKTLGRPINWEVEGSDQDWTQWTDAPILYIASHRFPQLTQADEAKLRLFVEGGGIIFCNADAADASFDSWVNALAQRLFPQYPMGDLPASSPLYNLQQKAQGRLPPLKGVSNGVRLLMVESPSDVALAWQNQAEKDHPDAFAVGLNLFVYADGGTTGQGQQFRNRLASPCVGAAAANPGAVRLGVARIKYDGQWDPEPGAWRRMARVFDQETHYSVDVTPVDFSALDPAAYPMATLTGVGAHQFTDAEAEAVRRYVEQGGTLLIDACGGSTACGGPAKFAESVETQLIPMAFPDQAPQALTAESPLLKATVRGMLDLTSPQLRPYAADQSNTGGFKLMDIAAGQGQLIYSPLDVTSGLLGTHTWGIAGYDPDYATGIVSNLLYWAASHRGM